MMSRPIIESFAFVCLTARSVVVGFTATPYNSKCVSPTTSLSTSLTSLSSTASRRGIDYTSLDITENARRNIDTFQNTWAPNSGIQTAGMALKAQRPEMKEVYAVTDQYVPTGSPVLYVPEAAILSGSKAMAELRISGIETAENLVAKEGLESELYYWYLILKLLVEIEKVQQSDWYPWINSLPRYFSNAVAMTDYCLLCLPPLMRKLAGQERSKQQKLCMESILEVPFLSDEMKSNKDYIKWAYQIVYTRAVETDDGDVKIIPMGDYFNHGSDYTEIEASYDEAGNYYAFTTYDVPAGSPLRISYGDSRNPSHLLARYGFLDENCPATYCKLLPPTVNQDMLDLGYSHERMLFYKTGEVADEVWDIFLYDILTQTNLADQQALMYAHRSGDSSTKAALHEKYYTETSQKLLDHVDSFIEDIDKLIAKAQTIGVDDPNSVYIKFEHPRLPLIHRHNLFVKETFQNVLKSYSADDPSAWRDATRVTLQECDDSECAIAVCVMSFDGSWACEGGLGDRPKTQTVISSNASAM